MTELDLLIDAIESEAKWMRKQIEGPSGCDGHGWLLNRLDYTVELLDTAEEELKRLRDNSPPPTNPAPERP